MLQAPTTRERALSTSTNRPPALTLRRRCSFSNQPATPPPRPCASMFSALSARVLHFLPFHSSEDWSSSSPTPSTSDSDFSLPLPASATKASFGDVVNEKPPSASRWFKGLPSIHAPIVLVISLFPISTAVVFFAVQTLPITVAWPKTLTDLATLGRELHGYSQSGIGPVAHIIGVMAITAVWKHAWSIPGSVIWNVLAGALFSPYFATILLTLLTTIGSIFATLLAAPLSPFIMHFLPKALEMTRSVLEGDALPTPVEPKSSSQPTSSAHTSGAWVRLSILRLVGVVPWSAINIACGVCNVSLSDCFLGTFIGTLPWTAVTCQIGDILQTVASTPSPTPQTVSSLLLSPQIIAKLVFLSFLSLAPILARDRLKSLIAPSESDLAMSSSPSNVTDRKSRRSWTTRVKSLRLPSRSRTREQREMEERMKQLESLVDEKRQIREAELQMEGLPS
ncbi:hypothetical protein D9758_008887 [Tetrapyrgos nigripes]|uniref:VTT domain-containing protein n=1 Tax=Tetrapyrgos nigripes TaxID=182062 RepID=A0A8H5CLS1_9AGAR|nr:hypothetical protein D9758_008887 [Tetrapyrgos nigripes]